MTRRVAFTLVELLVVISIIALLMTIVAAAWQSMTAGKVEAKALNTLNSYAMVARNYAMRHQLETVLAVDPLTGKLDLYVWDTLGYVDPDDPNFNIPPNTRYVLAPVLDDSATLPNLGEPTRPDNVRVRIAPIDYLENPDWRINDALTRFAICFDPHGRLVVRDLWLKYEPDTVTQTVPLPGLPTATFSRKVTGLVPAEPGAGPPPVLDIAEGVLPLSPEDTSYFFIRTSLGGVAYRPLEGAGDPRADPSTIPGDPNNPNYRNDQDRTDFLLNRYTGRAMLAEVQG